MINIIHKIICTIIIVLLIVGSIAFLSPSIRMDTSNGKVHYVTKYLSMYFYHTPTGWLEPILAFVFRSTEPALKNSNFNIFLITNGSEHFLGEVTTDNYGIAKLNVSVTSGDEIRVYCKTDFANYLVPTDDYIVPLVNSSQLNSLFINMEIPIEMYPDDSFSGV